jgi:hypothetical protein
MRINLNCLLITVFVLTATNTFAQVGIGTNTPAASAALEVSSISNNKGLLIPRITADQKDAIRGPVEGLMIYQTSAPAGFYYYTGIAWKLMVTQTDLDSKVAKVSGKDLSSNDYTSAEKEKLAAISGSNTSSQDFTSYATNIALILNTKENSENKSTSTALGTSDILYPTQKAVKNYVDTKVLLGSISDASTTVKGKVQLAGDLAGTSDSPIIANNAITTVKVADGAVVDSKIVTVNGSKITGNIVGNAANVTNIVAVSNGGTGVTTLTGFVKGNGTNPVTTLSSIPVSDVTGAVQKVNGSTPDVNGNVTLLFGNVAAGNLSARPANAGTNGNIYVVANDGTSANNGRTFISDGANWQEVTSSQISTDARYVKLSGSNMAGNLIFPSGARVSMADAPTSSTDLTNKTYVDAQVLGITVPDASGITKGKISLTGDLTGTADSPQIAIGIIDNARIANSANIADSKLATIASANKVSNSATTATSNNIVNSIVTRDANGNRCNNSNSCINQYWR